MRLPHVLRAALAATAVSLLDARGAADMPLLPVPDVEGAAHGFPSMRDLDGRRMADGEFTQQIEHGRLRIRISYEFEPGHRIEENASFQVTPALVQEQWSWTEAQGGIVLRAFRVDFASGEATTEKRDEHGLKRWSKHLKIEPGRTFAGFGFTLALQTLREGLLAGRKYEVQAIGFTPRPRLASIEFSYAGVDRLKMAGREIEGERFVGHPKIPLVARPFVRAPDTRIWLIHTQPTGFLRWEGALAELHDPIVRVDLLPGRDN